MRSKIMILLPAHDEEDGIGGVIDAVRAELPDGEVVVVDDGSSDSTCARARKAGATVLSLSSNMGYGCALQTGYKWACARGFDYLVQLDSDGQHDPGFITKLLDVVRSGDYDVCVGSRFLEGDPYKIPPLRRLGMIVFRRIASAAIGQTVTDPTSGFQAMNRKVIEFFCGDHYPVDYPDTDVLIFLHRHGFRIAEAPVKMYADKSGRSIHAGIRPLYYLFKMALTIPLNLIRREK